MGAGRSENWPDSDPQGEQVGTGSTIILAKPRTGTHKIGVLNLSVFAVAPNALAIIRSSGASPRIFAKVNASALSVTTWSYTENGKAVPDDEDLVLEIVGGAASAFASGKGYNINANSTSRQSFLQSS